MRLGALLNDAQFIGRLPTSVAGGATDAGNWLAMPGFCGPGSARLRGFCALMAPCAGRSGLPKVWALTLEAAPASKPPAADAASSARRDRDTISFSPAAAMTIDIGSSPAGRLFRSCRDGAFLPLFSE